MLQVASLEQKKISNQTIVVQKTVGTGSEV